MSRLLQIGLIFVVIKFFTIFIPVRPQYGGGFNPDAFKCPPEDEVEPCICDINGEMECYGSKITDQVLEEVFQRLVKFFATTQEKQLNALKLYKTEITQLEKTTLGKCLLLQHTSNQNHSFLHGFFLSIVDFERRKFCKP